jgi:hypothetical protein
MGGLLFGKNLPPTSYRPDGFGFRKQTAADQIPEYAVSQKASIQLQRSGHFHTP